MSVNRIWEFVCPEVCSRTRARRTADRWNVVAYQIAADLTGCDVIELSTPSAERIADGEPASLSCYLTHEMEPCVNIEESREHVARELRRTADLLVTAAATLDPKDGGAR